MSERKSIYTREITQSTLLFYLELHNKGVAIGEYNIDLLKKAKLIKDDEPDLPRKILGRGGKRKNLDHSTPTEKEREANDFIDIVFGELPAPDREDIRSVVLDGEQEIEEYEKKKAYSGGKQITKEDWLPKSKIYHSKEFVEWIDSINSGFQRMVPYKPFLEYCQQASDWLALNEKATDFRTKIERREFYIREFKRCQENSLYFLNRYGKIKEADQVNGQMDYDAKPVHKVIAYLFDCGYSFEMGKPRQIAATTTLGLLALKKILFTKNFFIKMIAQDEKKVNEIFEDKIKYPFGELPTWMKPNVFNDRDNLLTLKRKDKKGTNNGVGSKIQVVPPSVAAINGGAPPLILVDEAGYIGVLGKMIKEGRPTMFRENRETGLIEMVRQIIIWGTGGEMDKGGKAYEQEYMMTFKKWQKREFKYGIIPIFFDWTTRPGITKEHYEEEKKNYTSEGPDAEDRLVQFRQTYPSIIQDMFLTSHKTLVSINYIDGRSKDINDNQKELGCEYGFFEPIFDENVKMHDNHDVPYKIIGADFIPCEITDPRVTTKMFMRPKTNWINRYYSGTDPISTDNGFSKMATGIWDKHFCTVSCIVNYRDSDHKYVFLQNFLAKMYYGINGQMCPSLVEANVGLAYTNYVDEKGQWQKMVQRTELPASLSGGSHVIGVDNHGGRGNARNRIIVNRLHELIVTYGDRIWIDDFFYQLRTFTCTVTDKGTETWGTIDKKNYPDDVLFAVVYAYICSQVYDHLQPKEIGGEADKYRIRHILVRDKDGNLTRRPTKVAN